MESYRNQIKNLNNTIATMKIEADILDNYKTKVLQEQNEQYLRRIQELEREHKMIAPLMSELVCICARACLFVNGCGCVGVWVVLLPGLEMCVSPCVCVCVSPENAVREPHLKFFPCTGRKSTGGPGLRYAVLPLCGLENSLAYHYTSALSHECPRICSL